MTDPSITIHLEAAEALARIDPHNGNLLPKLVEWLKTGGVYTRIRCAGIVAQLGITAKAAVPALQRLENDQNPRVRAAVQEALHRIRTPAAARK